MFIKLNRQLRKLIFAVAAVATIAAFICSFIEKEENTDEHQTHEFDDIW